MLLLRFGRRLVSACRSSRVIAAMLQVSSGSRGTSWLAIRGPPRDPSSVEEAALGAQELAVGGALCAACSLDRNSRPGRVRLEMCSAGHADWPPPEGH